MEYPRVSFVPHRTIILYALSNIQCDYSTCYDRDFTKINKMYRINNVKITPTRAFWLKNKICYIQNFFHKNIHIFLIKSFIHLKC